MTEFTARQSHSKFIISSEFEFADKWKLEIDIVQWNTIHDKFSRLSYFVNSSENH